MNVPRILVLLAAIWAATPALSAPLEIYGAPPMLSAVRISPDGALLASIIERGERGEVRIQRSDTGQTVMEHDFGDQKLRDVQWAGPGHVIATTSQTSTLLGITNVRHEWFQAVDMDLERKTTQPLLWGVPRALNVIVGRPLLRVMDGKPVVFTQGALMVRGRGVPVMFSTDVDRHLTTIAAQGGVDTTDFVVDAKGVVIAQGLYDARRGRWSLDLWRNGWAEVAHMDTPIGAPEVLGMGRDGTSIAIAFGGDNGGVVRELDPKRLILGSPFPAPDPEETVWDPTNGKLIGDGGLIGETQRYEFFDESDQAAWNGAATLFPVARLDLSSLTEDHRKFVVRVDSPTDGPAYFLFNATTHTASLIGPVYEGLTAEDIGPVRTIAFKAGDGLALTGYLTLPRDRPAKGLPAVVLAHGGPAARDGPGFDWWAQALASRGYAVVQVNFRGSAGLGSALLSAGFGEWGRKMQTDLSDGVRFLAKQGVIDPARVCIVGASYGGYAALAGATLEPDVYRCAASVAGPSDVRKLVNWAVADRGDQGVGVERYWLRYMGPKSDLAAISPARQAGKAKIPILLVHGRDDTVVPYAQSRIMAEALTRAHKSVEFVTLDGEDHWLSRPETRLQMLQAVVAFLEKNNPATRS